MEGRTVSAAKGGGKGRGEQGRETVPVKKSRACVLDSHCREDLEWWVKTDPKIAAKVLELMDAVMRDPFQGIGKPEPLRFILEGCWSRRITQEHRLVYRVSDERIDFLQARYHY